MADEETYFCDECDEEFTHEPVSGIFGNYCSDACLEDAEIDEDEGDDEEDW